MAAELAPFTSILVPYDGSDPSRSALKHALALAHTGGKICIITVVDEAPLMSASAASMMPYDPSALLVALDEEGTNELADAVNRCRARGIAPTTELVHDATVPAIMAAAAKHDCDLIVMGTHGRRGLARLILGSTTDGVLRASEIPVLVVR